MLGAKEAMVRQTLSAGLAFSTLIMRPYDLPWPYFCKLVPALPRTAILPEGVLSALAGNPSKGTGS